MVRRFKDELSPSMLGCSTISDNMAFSLVESKVPFETSFTREIESEIISHFLVTS